MQVIALKGWERFQHYKDRDPPWVKLYRDLLTSESWVLGTDQSRLVQVASILLAARYSNRIPYRFDLIRKVSNLEMSAKHFAECLTHLSDTNFLEIQEVPDAKDVVAQDASKALAKCSSEERRGEESRRASAPAIEGLNTEAWDRWTSYRHEIRKPLKPASIPAAQKALAAFGSDQLAVVEQSIANGYQGLFALKQQPQPHKGINGNGLPFAKL